MRKNLLLIVIALVCGAMLTNCGGGSGSSGGGSKLKKNDYLGSIPTLYESYNAKTDAQEKKLETESEKLLAGGEKNYGKIQKLFDDQKVKEKELKDKLQADIKAEMEKIVGKDIPVSYSEQLKNSDMWYFDAKAKIAEQRGEPQPSITLTAKKDFTVPSMKAYDFNVYFWLVDKDGAMLERSASIITPISLERHVQSFTKDEVLIDSYMGYRLSVSKYAASRANLAGIQFVSKEEHDALK